MIQSIYHIGAEHYPVLALSIHNGHNMPDELLEICGISEADRLREEDPFTEKISQHCSNYITVFSSRFMVDLNRRPDMAIYQKPEDCWGLNARSKPIADSYLQELQRDYSAWYKMLDYQVQRFLRQHEKLIVLDLHSYNHRRNGIGAEADPPELNPDIIIGKSNMSPEYYPKIHELTKLLNGQNLSGYSLDCREDIKFTGGYLSRYLHNSYPQQVISLSIEFKKIFMNEWTGELNEQKFGGIIAIFWACIEKWLTEVMHIEVPKSK